ncbi:chemotaxis protein CheY [Pseudomonas sp. Pseusp97]|uniref:chemotaxis protein CheY n=1 Tax=Pseudomonas sp. Pseusp97 TaxID=3243065 RepID=UPI0039A44461
MANKTLRILIAENRHPQSLLVERMLNRMGYYRVATAASLDEARLLGRCTGRPFDVLIGSARLLNSERLDCTSLAGVYRNALVYQSQYLPADPAPLAAEGTVARLPGPLDASSLGAFMALIDPQALHRRVHESVLHS